MGLITQRSKVQILPPQPRFSRGYVARRDPFSLLVGRKSGDFRSSELWEVFLVHEVAGSTPAASTNSCFPRLGPDLPVLFFSGVWLRDVGRSTYHRGRRFTNGHGQKRGQVSFLRQDGNTMMVPNTRSGPRAGGGDAWRSSTSVRVAIPVPGPTLAQVPSPLSPQSSLAPLPTSRPTQPSGGEIRAEPS